MTIFGLTTKSEVAELERRIKVLYERCGIGFEQELDRIKYRYMTDPYTFPIKEELDKVLNLLAEV